MEEAGDRGRAGWAEGRASTDVDADRGGGKADVGPGQGLGRFEDWQILLREARDSRERIGVLLRMHEYLYPGHDPPEAGLIGKAAKEAGGWGRLAELLWQHSARPPTGDVLVYLLGVIKRGGKTSLGPPVDGGRQGPMPRAAEGLPPRVEPAPAPEYARLWGEILDELQGQMAAGTFQAYLARSEALSLADGVLAVRLGNASQVEWVNQRLRPIVERTVDGRWPVRVEFGA